MRLHDKTFEGTLTSKELDSPVGKLYLIASPRGLRAILSEQDLRDREISTHLEKISKSRSNRTLNECDKQLDLYFSGKLKRFKIQLDIVGTEFQKKAWNALGKIPFNQTKSYSDQAELLGSLNYVRAVGNANRRNPVSIVVPCHRVIGKSGKLVGYAGGLPMKEYLLKHEEELSRKIRNS